MEGNRVIGRSGHRMIGSYRLLYFFAGKGAAVLSRGTTKEREVPNREIERAIERKNKVEANFERYAFKPA